MALCDKKIVFWQVHLNRYATCMYVIGIPCSYTCQVIRTVIPYKYMTINSTLGDTLYI